MAPHRSSFALLLVVAAVAAGALGCGRAGDKAAVAPSPYPTDEASLSRPLPRPLPDVIARVNGAPVRVEQVMPMAKKDFEEQDAEDLEARKPLALRRALLRYVERELLVQEALGRGIAADTRAVDWAYDQMRRDHPDDGDWARFLAGQGLDPQRLKTELRVQQTVAALVDAELRAVPVSDDEAKAFYLKDPSAFAPVGPQGPAAFEPVKDAVVAAIRAGRRQEAIDALLVRLRAKARVEILI